MILFEHPIWPYLVPYVHMSEGRDNLDLLQLPDELRMLALQVQVNCVSCGRPINCLRARAKSTRSRVAGTETERRLFYAATCPAESDSGCSRTKAAQAHKDLVRATCAPAGEEKSGEVEATLSSETYDALCLKEPWLELILLGIKTLETRTKCLRKSSGTVVFASSKEYDEVAWEDPRAGGRLDAASKQRALAGCGKLVGVATMGGFRPGVAGVEDAAACITIAVPGGTRFVSPVSDVRRIVPIATVRVRPDGALVEGASQGFFKVPRSAVQILREAA